ncbi:hypothetical protein MAR_005529, partial [Mya arenaria]
MQLFAELAYFLKIDAENCSDKMLFHGNISSDAMNNNNHHHHHHHVGRHESTSSNGSYRSNGAPGGLHSPGTPLTGGASSLVIPQPLKPPQQKLPNKSIQCKMCDQ